MPVARSCPLAPNTISILALLLNLTAAALFLFGHFLLPIAIIIIAGFADALDGIVARVQQKESRFGDFLDHVCDRISDTALAACWMIGNRVREAFVVAAVIVIMLNGYMGTQIEATYGQRDYHAMGRGEFVLALIVFPIVSFILFSNGWAALEFGGLTIAEYLSLGLIAFALLGIVQRFALARRME